MIDPLERPRNRLEWARHHFETFYEKAFVQFGSGDTYEVVEECEIATRDEVARLHILKELDPEFGLVAGDVIHNLRATLDNLVWDFARIKADPPPDRTEFVIAFDKSAFQSNEYKLRGLHPPARDLVEYFQPYHAPEPERTPLYVLNRLWNDDKHRATPTAFAAYTSVGTAITEAHLTHGYPIKMGSPIVKHGAEIYRKRALQPGEYWDAEIGVSLDVAFGETTSVAANGVVMGQILVALFNFVANQVFPLFETIAP